MIAIQIMGMDNYDQIIQLLVTKVASVKVLITIIKFNYFTFSPYVSSSILSSIYHQSSTLEDLQNDDEKSNTINIRICQAKHEKVTFRLKL